MATSRGQISELLAPDLHRVYVETGKERPREYDRFHNVENMEWNPITDQQVKGIGTMPTKDEGTAFSLDEITPGGTKTYTAEPFGLAVEVTFEAWRDELYGVLREMVKELARAGRHREEVEAWSVFNNAFSTSFPGFTSGEALCATAHVGVDGTSRANRPTNDIGFSMTAIQDSLTRFENMTNESNMPQLMAPSVLLIAPENKFIAREILGSSHKPYVANNEINALIEDDLIYMVVHYFTTTTYWFLCAKKGEHDVNFLWRDRPIFDMFDDPYTKNAIATAYQRHTKGYATWRGVDGSTD